MAVARWRVAMGCWAFATLWQAAATLARSPAVSAEGGGLPVDWLPGAFVEVQVLGVRLWQWCGLLALLPLAVAAGWLGAAAVTRLVRRLEMPGRSLAGGPLRLAIGVLVFAAAEAALGLPAGAQAIVSGLETVLVIAALVWIAMRLLDVTARRIARQLIRQGQASAAQLVPSARTVLKVLLLVVAVIMALDNLGFDVTALVAGLGIGGLAFALAAQRSVENLFGGVTLYTDQPVRVGDFCRFGDRVGTIEAIGLRSTRIRTLDRTVVTVPNGQFATLQLENFSRRDKIWYHPVIGLRYETTPDQIRFILIEVRRMLYAHPKVDPDPARIRFVGFGASSLDFEIFAYVKTTDFGEYLEVAEDLNLRLMDIVERAGSSFAFPSTTTYIESGAGLGTERARHAEAQVREWRERDALYLPGFPPEKIAELGGTLDYPPRGSPLAAARRESAGNGRDGS
jgi:MscS family membrane protein